MRKSQEMRSPTRSQSFKLPRKLPEFSIKRSTVVPISEDPSSHFSTSVPMRSHSSGKFFSQLSQKRAGESKKATSRRFDPILVRPNQTGAEVDLEIVRKKVEQMYENVDFILNPRTPIMVKWGYLKFSLILISVFWTPYEVAFHDIQLDVAFWLNRAIDLFFITDFVLQFFLSYLNPVSGCWERSRREIIKHYVKGSMCIDLLVAFGVPICDIISVHSQGTSYDIATNISRLLPTTRLLRLVYFPILSKVAREAAEHLDENKWTYNKQSLVKFVIIIATLVHWMACCWRLVTEFEKPHEYYYLSWIVRDGLLGVPPTEQYVVCLYWAATTITTIGYGDIANPGTKWERMLAILTLLVGALVWAYIIGGICSIVQAFNNVDLEFSEQMGHLNVFMESKRMPLHLRERLRTFFNHRRSLEQDDNNAVLMEKMSPGLRGEVARLSTVDWIHKVPWLASGTQGFISSISIALHAELFAPNEMIAGVEMRVLTRGVVAKDARIYTRGSVWGVDMILQSRTLKNLSPARCLTYVHVLVLREEALEELLELYPSQRTPIRVAAIWMALRRSFVRYSKQMIASRIMMKQIAQDAKDVGVDIPRIFRSNDRENKKYLTKKEFGKVLRELGFDGPDSLLDIIRNRFDKHGNGHVDYFEFMTYFFVEFVEDVDYQNPDIDPLVALNSDEESNSNISSEDVETFHSSHDFVNDHESKRAMMIQLRERRRSSRPLDVKKLETELLFEQVNIVRKNTFQRPQSFATSSLKVESDKAKQISNKSVSSSNSEGNSNLTQQQVISVVNSSMQKHLSVFKSELVEEFRAFMQTKDSI